MDWTRWSKSSFRMYLMPKSSTTNTNCIGRTSCFQRPGTILLWKYPSALSRLSSKSCPVDREGREYLKIELDWDYKNRRVHLSMKPYLEKALRQFDNLVPTQRRDSLYPHIELKYGAKQQFADYDTSKRVGKNEQTHVQKVTGKFNYYAHAVDPTMLTPISALAAQQSKPTENTMQQTQHFLDYAATQEPALTTYRASDMVLAIHSDAGYLNEEDARSRAGGHHFLSEDVPSPPNNGAIHNEASIIKAVMSSAAKAEMEALYTNARKGVE
eukprot:scaffold67110_cov48-Cyclotella_meneghiniana.AAC.3